MTQMAGRKAWHWFVATAIVAILAGAAACTAGGGDEPPIRVKNGTLDLWLLSNRGEWTQDGNSRNWKLPGRRKSDDLGIVIAVGDGAVCKAPLERTGRKLEVHYSDATEVDLQSTGNHTKLTASKDLTIRRGTAQLLTYQGGPDDYISSIVLDGATVCSFTAKTQLYSLVILDY